MTAIALLRKDEIIQRVAEGAMLKDIARQLSVTPAAISNQLHADPDYIKAREHGAQARLEDQYERLEDAETILDVSRARETFRAATWFAEREFPARWGQKSQVTNINIDAGDWADRLRRSRERAAPAQRTTDVMLNGECKEISDLDTHDNPVIAAQHDGNPE